MLQCSFILDSLNTQVLQKFNFPIPLLYCTVSDVIRELLTLHCHGCHGRPMRFVLSEMCWALVNVQPWLFFFLFYWNKKGRLGECHQELRELLPFLGVGGGRGASAIWLNGSNSKSLVCWAYLNGFNCHSRLPHSLPPTRWGRRGVKRGEENLMTERNWNSFSIPIKLERAREREGEKNKETERDGETEGTDKESVLEMERRGRERKREDGRERDSGGTVGLFRDETSLLVVCVRPAGGCVLFIPGIRASFGFYTCVCVCVWVINMTGR